MIKNLEINANLKFNSYPGVKASVNVNKLSPKWMIMIGSLLVAYGLYLYLNQEKKEVDYN